MYVCNFLINELNTTFVVYNMGNEVFQNASFGNASFPNEALNYSCLSAQTNATFNVNITFSYKTHYNCIDRGWVGYIPIAGSFSVSFLRKSATFIVDNLWNLKMVRVSQNCKSVSMIHKSFWGH